MSILTAEEQKEYREEIDYLIETRGYEYVWGYDTPGQKILGAIRNTPDKIAAVLQSPGVQKANEKIRSFAEQVNSRDGLGDEIDLNPRHYEERKRRRRENSSGLGMMIRDDDHL